MDNKKKRAIEAAMNQNHNSKVSLASMNSAEIKQEPNIKEEPLSVGELVDVPVPVWNGRHVVSSSDVDRSNGEYDFDDLHFDHSKVEVKEEDKEKKETESKIDDKSAEDAMENRNDQQQLPPQNEADFPPSKNGHAVMNTNDCSKIGDLENALKKHKCDICEYATKRSADLKKHLVKHTGEKQHGCDFCPKRFTKKQDLRAHMKVHVEEFLFCCSGCLQGFDVEEEKNEHEINCKIHRYECYLCKESFGSMKANMMIHLRVHSGNRPFECKECFKQFTQKSSLNQHMKLHAGPRTFRCSICRLLFSHEEERNAHEEKCNRPVSECDICGKSFGSNESNLTRHMRTHSGETPFECQRCLKQFKRNHTLNNHMKFHTKKLPFKCLICRLGFLKDDKRMAHQRNCNGRYYECYLCKKFCNSNVAQLKSHMHNHSGKKPFQCELCRNQFTLKWGLKIHMKNVHQEKQ